MKLVLKNGTSYTVLERSTSTAISLETELSQLQTIKDSFTIDNLSTFKFTTDDDILMGEYINKQFDYLDYKNNIATFYLKGVNASERDRKSMQEQIDEIAFSVIPEVMSIIEILTQGGE